MRLGSTVLATECVERWLAAILAVDVNGRPGSGRYEISSPDLARSLRLKLVFRRGPTPCHPIASAAS
jgi:hypothetical protein